MSVKLVSVGDKWRIVSEARKLSKSASFKDIFISSDLTIGSKQKRTKN